MHPDATARDAVDARLSALTPAERFMRALALSAYVRALAWQGARLHAGAATPDAVRDRFLEQLYGAAVARDVRSRMAAGTRHG